MADTIREQIIQDIVASVEGSSFTTLSGATVTRGQFFFQKTIDSLPAIVVFVEDEIGARNEYGAQNMSMEVVIDSLVEIGGNNVSELGEAVLGELVKAAFRAQSNDLEKMVYTGSQIYAPKDLGRTVLSVRITVGVDYVTDLGDPYTLTS